MQEILKERSVENKAENLIDAATQNFTDNQAQILDQSSEICEIECIHEDVLMVVKSQMPDENSLADLADFFKNFGDTTRIKILWALSVSQMCVCDIAALLSMSQSSISHQLRVLKSSKIVKNRREGKIVYYSLTDEHIAQIFKQGLIHIKE